RRRGVNEQRAQSFKRSNVAPGQTAVAAAVQRRAEGPVHDVRIGRIRGDPGGLPRDGRDRPAAGPGVRAGPQARGNGQNQGQKRNGNEPPVTYHVAPALLHYDESPMAQMPYNPAGLAGGSADDAESQAAR